MTFKSLMNFGNLGKAPWDTPIERYHNDGGGHHYHGHRGNSKGQSLQDNNSTSVPSTTAVLLRDTELPIVLDNGEEKNVKMKDDFVQIENMHNSRTKGYIQREV
ncbi:hypothetical protein X777_10201 [Ooceraea biroi]|uniref:Uncharacterized protein n=1 Tax=Ooceraea biroi TaxID=2015173 RepID=A0A026X3I4_OOCBI|nr:hypothetical protein X777_10201 [Ooceraea biroi]